MIIPGCWIFDIVTNYIVKDEQSSIDSPEHFKTVTSFASQHDGDLHLPYDLSVAGLMVHLSLNHGSCSPKTDRISQHPRKLEDELLPEAQACWRDPEHTKRNALSAQG